MVIDTWVLFFCYQQAENREWSGRGPRR